MKKAKIILTFSIIIGVIAFAFLFILQLGNIKEQTDVGKRFTYDDGIALFQLFQPETTELGDVYRVYGDVETPFKTFLLESLK